jgi:DNA-binding winged helix-turn-helix (wHTH) protein
MKDAGIIRRRLSVSAGRPGDRPLRRGTLGKRSADPDDNHIGSSSAPTSIRLGVLDIRPAARMVLRDGVPVELGGRAFDLLMVLIEARGGIVSKDALMGRVWPSVTVIDSNLKVQLSLLRRALGAERWRVKTISGRGYLLVADDVPTAADQPLVIVLNAPACTQHMIARALLQAARDLEQAAACR